MKYLSVPEEDIEAIEEARKHICNLFETLHVDISLLFPITQPMWRLTHKKYKEVDSVQD